jgi:gamma-butyrobetaine dioxygenase
MNLYSQDGALVLDELTALFAGPGAAVTEPVRLHVAAKRYLCATSPGYFALLSPESVRTLAAQGGPMNAAEAAAFESGTYFADAVAVRRWDEAAKDPAGTPPPFEHFEGLLRDLAAG